MTEPAPPFPWPDLVRFQLSLLELYEALLESPGWEEAKVNSILKTFMASMLALIRLQQSVGGQVVATQQEMIRKYRAGLEAWLHQHEGASDGAAAHAASAGGAAP